jgi:hypothetical protein
MSRSLKQVILSSFFIDKKPIGDVPASGAAEDPVPIGCVGFFFA